MELTSKIRLLLQPKLLSNIATAAIQVQGIFSPFSPSNSPAPEDTKYETYLLRRNLSTTVLKTSTRIPGPPLLLSKIQTHTAATHYIKPLASSGSEISY